jgi:hypothetical protein
VTGELDHWEHERQQAAARLHGSRDSEHIKDDISFILDPMATKIYRGVCNYMILMWFNGIDKQRCGLPGTCMPIGSSAAAWLHGQQAREKNDNSFRLDDMTTKFYGDMCKYMVHTWIEGFAIRGCRLLGTNASTDCNTAVQKKTATRLWETLPDFDHTQIMTRVLQRITYKHDGDHDRGPHIGVSSSWI